MNRLFSKTPSATILSNGSIIIKSLSFLIPFFIIVVNPSLASFPPEIRVSFKSGHTKASTLIFPNLIFVFPVIFEVDPLAVSMEPDALTISEFVIGVKCSSAPESKIK